MVDASTSPARQEPGVTVSVRVWVPGAASLGTVTGKFSVTVLCGAMETGPGRLTVQPAGARSVNSARGIP